MRYTREEGCRAWLATAYLTPAQIHGLFDQYGTAEAIYDRVTRSGTGFMSGLRIDASKQELLKTHAAPDAMHSLMLSLHKHEIGVIGRDDLHYPDALQHIPSPPEILFYQGSLDCLMGKCVTVIGSRSASLHGIEATERLCCELSEHGVTIASGFAEGIDRAAHRGCLKGGSPTAAVLASGIDVDYPADTFGFKHEIVRSGGVLLSEYPPGQRAASYVFKERNRILSGLSKAVIVMEAGIKSGCMLTVSHALEQGRDVLAYPGIPGSQWSAGAHELLREGATYFTTAEDVLEDLGWLDDDVCIKSNPSAAKSLPPLTEDQRRIYSLLAQCEELSYDQLAAQTGFSAPSLSVSLTMLQMMGLIKALPGKSYCKV